MADVSKHVLSPQLVDAISKSTQVVWSTCTSGNGLLGRSDMKLQTAVGMPVAMDAEGNMCVVVMFSPRNLESSEERMEYLQAIYSFASANMGEAMPRIKASDPSDSEIEKSSEALTHQHREPITTHFISLNKPMKRTLSSPNFSQAKGDEGAERATRGVEITHVHTLSAAPKDSFGIPMLPSGAELLCGDLIGTSREEFKEGGVPALMSSADSSEAGSQSPDSEQSDEVPVDDFDYSIWSSIVETREHTPPGFSPFDLGHLQQETRERVEEFVYGFLGLSSFDAADVWHAGPSQVLSQIFTMTTETAPVGFESFREFGSNAFAGKWDGAIGRCYATGDPVWDTGGEQYDRNRVEVLKKVRPSAARLLAASKATMVYGLWRAVWRKFNDNGYYGRNKRLVMHHKDYLQLSRVPPLSPGSASISYPFDFSCCLLVFSNHRPT